jgi:hypothetical protein
VWRPHLQDEFNFGQVYIGAYSKLPLVLTNTTSVAARLAVDLVRPMTCLHAAVTCTTAFIA